MKFTKRHLEFVKLLPTKLVADLLKHDSWYANIFRVKGDKGWEYSGVDVFTNLYDCRKWATEYLTYPENKKEEILACVKVTDIIECHKNLQKKELQ